VSRPTTSPRALAGVRVLELGEGVAAPFCSRVLSDLGASVTKLECAGGDPARAWPPHAADGTSGMFAFLNAGKELVSLSGETTADRATVQRLAEAADIIVVNLDDERATAWGIDLDAIDAGNAVWTRLSRFGGDGPWAKRRGEALSTCAVGGVSVVLGEPNRAPLSLPFEMPSLQAGLHGAAATLTALLDRAPVPSSTTGVSRGRSGGRRIDIAESEVLAFYAGGMSRFILGAGGKWARRGFERHGGIYPSGFYPCKDGFIFLATQTRKQWNGFLRLMGDPDWARENSVYQDGVAIGWKHADEVDVHFIPWLAQHTRRELTKMAKQADLVLGPINDAVDVLEEPHLEARDSWAKAEVGSSSVRIPKLGFVMSRTPLRGGSAEVRADQPDTSVEFIRGNGQGDSRNRTAGARGRPLSGLRAIEFGFNWAGPMVGQILSDMGMEVIKIETEGRLDFMRHWPHARSFFHNTNRGKLSASINVKTDAGRDLVRRLAARSDLVFDNFAAGVMARNQLGYEDLRREAPGLVVLSMAMAGQCGPLAHLRGFATIATGFAGFESAIGYPDSGSTGLPVIGVGDANAAIQAVTAALAALWHKRRTGEGQFIDLSQVEAAAALAGEPLLRLQLEGEEIAPRANAHRRMAPHGVYPVAGEDRWLALSIADDAEWRVLVELMGRPQWALDERLAGFAGRQAAAREIDAELAKWTVGEDRDALVERLSAAGLAAAPVLGVEEMAEWPQFAARGIAEQVASFEGKDDIVYRTPWHMSDTPRAVPGGSPKIGEHNDRVLREILELSADEIEQLQQAGVVQ